MDTSKRAKVLVQAMPYIKKYAGETIVVKYGGNAMINEELKSAVMSDLVLMQLVGINVVLVHGGGPEISSMLKAVGNVKTGQITYAVRDTEIDDMEIHEGDILGISEKGIRTAGKDIKEITKQLIAGMIDDDSEFLTVYYGKDISPETADALSEELEELYPDLEIEVKYGGQPLYYYIFSIE